MRFYDGMTLKDIAKIEGVTYQKIQRSLEAALKKIKKFFPNGV